MKNKAKGGAPRPYRQTVRADAAAETGRRIIDAFVELSGDLWFDELTLNEIAERAGVSVQSVIRRYGGKDGLISAAIEQIGADFGARRAARPGDVTGSIAGLFDIYEQHGDGVIRNLAQEDRYPELRRITDFGRKEHRRLTAEVYSPWLSRLSAAASRQALDALIVATDIYTWKLFRRDMGRSVAEARAAMMRLVNAVLVEHTGTPIAGAES